MICSLPGTDSEPEPHQTRGPAAAHSGTAAKGISKETIEEAVEEFRASVDERELALKVAADRVRVYARGDSQTAKRRLAAYLLRRGFSIDDVHYAVENVVEQERQELPD